jgi:hypothetical protein
VGRCLLSYQPPEKNKGETGKAVTKKNQAVIESQQRTWTKQQELFDTKEKLNEYAKFNQASPDPLFTMKLSGKNNGF